MPSGVSASTVFTLLGFCASVLFIVFVCSRLVCALFHRRRRRRHRPGFPPVAGLATAYSFHQGQAAGGGGGGLDPAAIAAFPTRAFSTAAGPRSTALCVVCLAEYEDNDVLRLLPYCGHNFHVACIDIWLKQQSTCPVCRVTLHDGPDSKHTVPPLPSAVVVIPPCSPESSRSDPCHCLFVGAGYSPRTPEVLTNEPDQGNQIQIVCHPSVDRGRGNNLTSSEVNSPGENNNQTVKLQMESPRVHGRS